MSSFLPLKSLFLLLILNLAACGSDEESVLERLSYDIDEEKAKIELEFNQNLELNTELTVPVREYGALSLFPSTDEQGFIVLLELNHAIFNDAEIVDLSKTRLLPNGQNMSRYVESDVVQIGVNVSEKVKPSIYLGLEEEQHYLGFALELPFLGKDFPSGLVISQRLSDAQKRPLGVVTIFGPKMNGEEIEVSGGIFFMGNLDDLVGYMKNSELKNFTKNGPGIDDILIVTDNFIDREHRSIYSKDRNRYKLFKRYQKLAKDADYID